MARLFWKLTVWLLRHVTWPVDLVVWRILMRLDRRKRLPIVRAWANGWRWLEQRSEAGEAARFAAALQLWILWDERLGWEAVQPAFERHARATLPHSRLTRSSTWVWRYVRQYWSERRLEEARPALIYLRELARAELGFPSPRTPVADTEAGGSSSRGALSGYVQAARTMMAFDCLRNVQIGLRLIAWYGGRERRSTGAGDEPSVSDGAVMSAAPLRKADAEAIGMDSKTFSLIEGEAMREEARLRERTAADIP